jgi:hypothetical protein
VIGRVGGRLALVVLAVAAIVWLAYDLRDLSLNGKGRAQARGAHSAAQVARVLSLYSQATRLNADPTPRIDEARFLLGLGRAQAATRVLNAVVDRNPGNLIAWSLLAKSAAVVDPPRAAEAAGQLRVLFGHPKGYALQQTSITTRGGLVAVAPQLVIGLVETTGIAGKVAKIDGWALDAERILITANGRLVATGVPNLNRPDVARVYGPRFRLVGFKIPVPLALLEPAGRKAKVAVFASKGNFASQLPVSCRTTVQEFGCGG